MNATELDAVHQAVGARVAAQLRAQQQERAERIAEAVDTLARRSAGLVMVINDPFPPKPDTKAALESWVAQARAELVAAIAGLPSPTAPSSHPGGAT